MEYLRTLIKRALGNPNYKRDIVLPDEKKGKPVGRRRDGSVILGGDKDDPRRIELNERAAEQSIENLRRMSEHVRKLAGRKK